MDNIEEKVRKLASIQKIESVSDIAGADKIQAATVKGWQVVIRKGEFKVGDKCVFFEIDSILPKTTWSEFLVDKDRPDKIIRLKTRKMRGTLSQGLVLPISMVGIDGEIDENVTEKLNVTKYDKQLLEEQAESVQSSKKQSKVVKFLMNFAPFRFVYLRLNKKEKGNFPSSVSKTDEENCQNSAYIISNNFNESFYISEKLEGQSVTFFTDYEKSWGFKKKIFGTCSRNLWLKTPNQSKYWESARKYDIEKILTGFDCRVSIQAEQIGVGIQGNIYKLPDVQIRVFNVNIDGKRLSLYHMKEFCDKFKLPMVPVLEEHFTPSNHISSNDKETIVKWLLNYSNGVSKLYKIKREGVVIRLNKNPNISFKVRSPEYLIEHDE